MMKSIVTASLTLLISSAAAFKDTSPFFLFSTSSSFGLSSSNIAHASSVTSSILPPLSQCPSDTYILVSQPLVNSADFAQGLSIPHLRNALNGSDGSTASKSALIVTELVGALDTQHLQHVLTSTCGAQLVHIDASSGSIPPAEHFSSSIIRLDFPPLPAVARSGSSASSSSSSSKEREEKLKDHDAFLHAVLSSVGARSFTVLYTTTPASLAVATPGYEMDEAYDAAPRLELRRAVGELKEHGDGAPLFEKYIFVSPAILMGLFATFILSSIGYVGLSALSSLQVSYFAFSKEMGPSGKKQQ